MTILFQNFKNLNLTLAGPCIITQFK